MTTKKRHKIIPEVYLVLIQDKEVLLIRRANTGFEDGKYTLVAGHVEAGESFTEALLREAHEEAGLKLVKKDLRIVHVMHRKCEQEERIGVFIRPTSWQNKPQIMEPHKHDDMRWVPLAHLPENISSYVKTALEKINSNEFFSEL